MKIEILGPGCKKCRDLAAHATEAADELGLEYELVHVTELSEFLRRGMMLPPALWIDGRKVVQGRSSSKEELVALLQEGAAAR